MAKKRDKGGLSLLTQLGGQLVTVILVLVLVSVIFASLVSEREELPLIPIS